MAYCDTKNTILVVDDDADVREALRGLLSTEYSVEEAPDGKSGLELAEKHLPDLILLDLKMPMICGKEVCRKLKANPKTKDIAVVILTASSETQNLVDCFNLGADDFVEKPFKAEALMARIAAKLRNKQRNTRVRAGNIVLDLEAMQAYVGESVREFSTLEFNLLRYFIDHKNNVVKRGQVLEGVWQNVSVSDRTVDAHIVSLRKKINGSTCELKTIYGSGYKLMAP